MQTTTDHPQSDDHETSASRRPSLEPGHPQTTTGHPQMTLSHPKTTLGHPQADDHRPSASGRPRAFVHQSQPQRIVVDIVADEKEFQPNPMTSVTSASQAHGNASCSMADEWKPNPLTSNTDENGRCGFQRPRRRTTLSMNCNWEISAVSRTVRTMGISHCKTTGMSTTLSKNCKFGISTGFHTVAPVVAQQRACEKPGHANNLVQSP